MVEEKQDRRITDELGRSSAADELIKSYLRDNPDVRVVKGFRAPPPDLAENPPPHDGKSTAGKATETRPRQKWDRIDLALACLIVVVAFGLLHFLTPLGKTDTITSLVYAVELDRWGLAAVDAVVLLVCGLLFIPLAYLMLRYIRYRAV